MLYILWVLKPGVTIFGKAENVIWPSFYDPCSQAYIFFPKKSLLWISLHKKGTRIKKTSVLRSHGSILASLKYLSIYPPKVVDQSSNRVLIAMNIFKNKQMQYIRRYYGNKVLQCWCLWYKVVSKNFADRAPYKLEQSCSFPFQMCSTIEYINNLYSKPKQTLTSLPCLYFIADWKYIFTTIELDRENQNQFALGRSVCFICTHLISIEVFVKFNSKGVMEHMNTQYAHMN